MPKKKRPRRPEPLVRFMEVVAVGARIWFSTGGHNEVSAHFEGNARLELKAKMDEPIRGVLDVEIVTYPKEDTHVGINPVPWIGTVNGFKPVVRVALFVPEAHFERLWTIAMGGLLRHASIWMTRPLYLTVYVTNLEFSC